MYLPSYCGSRKTFFFFYETHRSFYHLYQRVISRQQFLVLECLIKKTCLYLMAWSLVIQMEKKKSDHLLDNG